MKNSIFSIVIFFTIMYANNLSQPLKIGMEAPKWLFKDLDGKSFTMDDWKGKILQVNYVDPDESEMNEPFNDAVKKAIEVDSLISRKTFKGFGIVDCNSTWKPSFLVKTIAGRKAKKFNTTILFDYDAELRKLWGLKKDSYNVVILDQNRICRAIVRGKVSAEKQEELIQIIIDLQKDM